MDARKVGEPEEYRGPDGSRHVDDKDEDQSAPDPRTKELLHEQQGERMDRGAPVGKEAPEHEEEEGLRVLLHVPEHVDNCGPRIKDGLGALGEGSAWAGVQEARAHGSANGQPQPNEDHQVLGSQLVKLVLVGWEPQAADPYHKR